MAGRDLQVRHINHLQSPDPHWFSSPRASTIPSSVAAALPWSSNSQVPGGCSGSVSLGPQLYLPDRPQSLAAAMYSAQHPQGPRICVKPYTSHMQTVQTREHHRFDTESLYNGISQCPVHTGGTLGGPAAIPQESFQSLYTVAFSMFFFCLFVFF